MKKLYFAFALLVLLPGILNAESRYERPLQYVVLAFDGAGDIPRWREIREFAQQMQRKGTPVHFTFFLSSVYFLRDDLKNQYVGPGHFAGQSDVGFGGTSKEVEQRILETEKAKAEGHEMASHLNGHFSGDQWKAQDWDKEFHEFYNLLFNAPTTNHLSKTARWNFEPKDISGFRAPYLATSPWLWDVIRKYHFRYDASLIDQPDVWPDHKSGYWNFPLAQLRVAGSGKKTLSMDYNFFVAQSGAKEDPEQSYYFQKQMYETYAQYFLKNYNGNRAPVKIGHHFPLMNGGAYWRGLQQFAKLVCGIEDVRCVSFSELADYMDTLTPEQLVAYQQAQFPKKEKLEFELSIPASELYPAHIDHLFDQKQEGEGIPKNNLEIENIVEKGENF